MLSKKKIVIGIHGLGNKPPRTLLSEWWRRAIGEGLQTSGYPRYSLNFRLVYWADILHPQPLSREIKDENDARFLDSPYIAGTAYSQKEPSRIRQKILDFIDKKLLDIFLNEDFSINFSRLTDKILRRYFSDLEEYYQAKYVNSEGRVQEAKQVIRQRLADTLYKHRKSSILLIAHSMGSIIAFDVLNHPSCDVKVDTLVTIGSPLGIPVVMHKIAAEQAKRQNLKLAAPDNIISGWYNLSDLEDKVAVNYRLSDDYAANCRGVIPQDFIVYNNYEVKGKRNPHAAYGYLRAPETAGIINEFIIKERWRWVNWLDKKYNAFQVLKRELFK